MSGRADLWFRRKSKGVNYTDGFFLVLYLGPCTPGGGKRERWTKQTSISFYYQVSFFLFSPHTLPDFFFLSLLFVSPSSSSGQVDWLKKDMIPPLHRQHKLRFFLSPFSLLFHSSWAFQAFKLSDFSAPQARLHVLPAPLPCYLLHRMYALFVLYRILWIWIRLWPALVLGSVGGFIDLFSFHIHA